MVIVNEKMLDRLVTIYSMGFNDEPISGFINVYDENEIIIACVDSYGYNNGYVLLRADDIYRMDCDSEYEIKLSNLYQLNKQEHEMIIFNTEDISFMDDLLLWAYKKRKMVTIKFESDESEICGYIKDIETSRMQLIDIYECKIIKGFSYVDFQRADWIWIDEKKAKDAEMVLKYRGCINDD